MRVEVVAEQQRRVVVGRVEQARRAVVDEVALVDRLEPEREARGSPSGEKIGRSSRSSSGRSDCLPEAALGGGLVDDDVSTCLVRGFEERADGLDGAVDLGVAVRERDEHRLELRRGDVDAVREQVAEERAVAFRVAPLRVVEVADAGRRS